MRLQGLVKAALAGGFAVASFSSLSTNSFAQCANCGATGSGIAGSYTPGAAYAPGTSFMPGMPSAAGAGSGNTTSYGNVLGQGTQPLFDNYFTQGNANQATAGMYMSPIGVPGSVGHTYYTYQPFYPHHYLYQHKDRYHSYYDDGRGLNRTHASYYAPPARSAVHWAYKSIRLPHQ